MLDFNDYSPYHHLFISMGLGLLVGLQREWAESPIAGIRSFTVVSLLGTVSSILSENIGNWFIGVGLIGAIAVSLVVRHNISTQHKIQKGIVTEISLILMFCIGVMVNLGPTILAASIAVLLAFILQVKIELHTMVAKFNKNEIRSIMQFMVITLVILPVLPTNSFGPNNVINLHNIWLIVILITGVSLAGYIILKFSGNKAGLFWGGILGGIISSTATTFSYSKIAKDAENMINYNALIILIAWSTLYIRVFIELYSVAPNFNVTMPLLFMLLISSWAIFWLWKKRNGELNNINIFYNPTDLKTAISFAIFYFLIIYAFTFLKENTGPKSLYALAFFSGILDVDAVTLSTGRLVERGLLTNKEAFNNCFLSIGANIAFKGIISRVVGGEKLFKVILFPWLISLISVLGIITGSILSLY